MLYETPGRAEELLSFDVADLDTANRCEMTTRKGGAKDVIAWQTGTARLLPLLLTDRRRGSVFLTDRKTKHVVVASVIDPVTLRRLSYRRALELFGHHTTDFAHGPFSLNQLRHSRLTHVVEEGTSTPTPTRMSGHTPVRAPSRYARPSGEALMALQASTDSAARRTARRT
ncbi:tyrosine-type recombinase/integrase [Nocardia zapadnayensis]|nr:tyrosine-type recombinase/integrase [Nocardia zapadnayensis]MCX0274941.1 tyrosine-type recombinase/integrase [Nocardia zapadnayensis]